MQEKNKFSPLSIIEVENLTKCFGAFTAVNRISFSVGIA
jgi:ABC-type multidrug transport system ATPase subunit